MNPQDHPFKLSEFYQSNNVALCEYCLKPEIVHPDSDELVEILEAVYEHGKNYNVELPRGYPHMPLLKAKSALKRHIEREVVREKISILREYWNEERGELVWTEQIVKDKIAQLEQQLKKLVVIDVLNPESEG